VLLKNIYSGPLDLATPDRGTHRPLIQPGATVTVPAALAESVLYQVWWWEAADDEARTVAAAHPEWWDHPHVAEVAAAGATVAARPEPATTTATKEH
jgi:hypothetical protein